MAEDGPRLGSETVGSAIELPERRVSWRDTMAYAAAVADLDSRYLDDTAPAELMAPPLYAVAFTWPAVDEIAARRADGEEAVAIAATGVHASEHILFHRPIRPGDRLAVRARICSLRPTRAGAYQVLRIDAVDEAGADVVTLYHGSMFRGVDTADGGRSVEDPPSEPAPPNEAEVIHEVEIPIPRELPWLYDGCTGIVNPIHTSLAFATGPAGLPDVILQGTCTLALAARELVLAHGAEPELLRELACRFAHFVIPGTNIHLQTLAVTAEEAATAVHFRVLNAAGEVALDRAYARFAKTLGGAR